MNARLESTTCVLPVSSPVTGPKPQAATRLPPTQVASARADATRTLLKTASAVPPANVAHALAPPAPVFLRHPTAIGGAVVLAK